MVGGVEVEPETIDEVVRKATDLRQDEIAREANEIVRHGGIMR